jgi:hypothetical protein
VQLATPDTIENEPALVPNVSLSCRRKPTHDPASG